MSEEPHVSGEQTSVAAAPVGVNDSNAQFQGATGEQSVPLAALQSERAQRQQLQSELQMIKDHLVLMQANQGRPQEKPKDDFEGLRDEDVMTVGEFKKLAGQFNRKFESGVEEIRMTQKYPDYQEVVSKYLPDVLKEKPELRTALQKSQDYELAYYLAKNSESYRTQSRSIQKNADAERIVQNATKAGSLSSIGHTTMVNHAKRYKDMSDSDFAKEVNKNLGYS